jgi:hypothetical protein
VNITIGGHMKIQDMSMEQLLASLAAECDGTVTSVDPREFDKPENVLNMPLKSYINMSEMHAIDVHLNNLIATYGIDAVKKGMERV